MRIILEVADEFTENGWEYVGSVWCRTSTSQVEVVWHDGIPEDQQELMRDNLFPNGARIIDGTISHE